VLAAALVGCSKDDDDDEKGYGDWPAIKVTASQVAFSVDGGSQTVSCVNYSNWWVSAIALSDDTASTTTFTGSNGKKATNGWVTAEVVNKNQLTITAAANAEGTARTATIAMTVGDAYTTLTVTQYGNGTVRPQN